MKVVYSLNEAEEIVYDLPPGVHFTYHVGRLAHDRTKSMYVNAIADVVWKAYRRNRVSLVQQRLDDGQYRYIAIGRDHHAKAS